MATKLNPGAHDCHARALPDEPLFTLLARDPLAPFLVSIWASMRMGDIEAASAKFRKMQETVAVRYLDRPDVEPASEASDCALAMFAWRPANDGRWREPVQAPAHTGLAGTGRLKRVTSDGWAGIERNGRTEESYLFPGVRFAYVGPDPRNPKLSIIHFMGGANDPPAPLDELVPDEVVATISVDGLIALAADIAAAAASAAEEVAALSPRQVL